MITSASPVELGLPGWLKSAAGTAAKVTGDPNVQRAAGAAAQQLAPTQYAQAAQQAARARAVYNAYRGQRPGTPMPPGMPMPIPMMPPQEEAPAGHGGILTIALLGGGALILVLLLAK